MVIVEADARGLARVSLNRPDKHNAFDAGTIAELTTAFATLGTDPAVRAILLAGQGASFCAGADTQWMRDSAALSEAENRADAMRLSDMLATIDSCPRPVLCIAHGFVFGGGVGLVACADLVVVRNMAKFRLSEVRLGLTPATIAPFVLAKIGVSAARRYMLTAEDFNAEEACRMGLVHAVSDDADAQVEAWFAALLEGGPGAIADAKALVRDVADRPITTSLRTDTAGRIAARRASAEGQEGLQAFIARRKPVWAPQ